jgi:RNA polymerase sigma factor (sigma-70 family)
MRDGGIVAGIVAGDPAALDAAYDHYAPALYAYCRSLLSDPAPAAAAVHDTYVVAALRLRGLRDPSRLRPWLYAVARNECRRQLSGTGAAVPGEVTADLADAADTHPGEVTADFGPALEEAELREVVCAALAGLSPADREIVELSLRHEFYGADLADALGVPRNQAHALTSRGRAAFETALGALLVSRSGQGSCGELAEILSSWDGELTTAIRKQVQRHSTGCPVCSGQRRRELSPVALLGLLPVPPLPGDLRQEVFDLIMDGSPEALGRCVQIAQRAEPFNRAGFPVPLDPVAPVRGPAAFMPAAGVVVAVFALFGGGAMLASNALHHGAQPVTSALSPQVVPSAQPAPSAAPPTGGAGSPGRPGAGGQAPVGVIGSLAALPSPLLTGAAPGSAGPSSSPLAGGTTSASPTASRSTSASPSPSPSRTSASPSPTTASPSPTTASPSPTTASPSPTTASPSPTTAAPTPTAGGASLTPSPSPARTQVATT